MSEPVQIGDVVDVRKYPYVVPYQLRYETRYGLLVVLRGFIYDGASSAPDVYWKASAVHDMLYLKPVIDGKPITKSEADWLYGYIIRFESQGWFKGLIYHRGSMVASLVRPLVLHVAGWPAWDRHRRDEQADPEGWWRTRIVPLQDRWEFDKQTWRTADSVLKPEYADTPAEDFARHNLALI